MFSWYENAAICYAYLQDLPDVPVEELDARLTDCQWFYRGWTLQELIAPTSVMFFNQLWKEIGTKGSLRDTIFRITSINREVLAGISDLAHHSAAEKMSWASNRTTSRIEDQAYCLLGLHGINMPLMYGERENAFRRLQEAIMAKTNDHSLFTWTRANGDITSIATAHARSSILASSPRDFARCNGIKQGFLSHRSLFDLSDRGVMLQVHRSYDPKILELLVEMCKTYENELMSFVTGLTVPLNCFRYPEESDCGYGGNVTDPPTVEVFLLQLILDGHKWRYVGVSRSSVPDNFYRYLGKPACAYDNDYVRLEIHHEHGGGQFPLWSSESRVAVRMEQEIRWIHLRNTESMVDGEVLRTRTDIRTVAG